MATPSTMHSPSVAPVAWYDRALADVEVARTCFLLMPSTHDGPHAFLIVPDKPKGKPRVFCDCSSATYARCSHARKLISCYNLLRGDLTPPLPSEPKAAGLIGRLFTPLIRGQTLPLDKCELRESGDRLEIDGSGRCQIICSDYGAVAKRFRSRMGHPAPGDANRATALRRAVRFVLSELEQAYEQRGVMSTRRAAENSLWQRLLYHCIREYDEAGLRAAALVDEHEGALWVVLLAGDKEMLRWRVPDESVTVMIAAMAREERCELPFTVAGDETELLLRTRWEENKARVTIEPHIRLGDTTENMVRFRSPMLFGRHYYEPSRREFVPLSSGSLAAIAWGWQQPRTMSYTEFSELLEQRTGMFSIDRAAEGQTSLFGDTSSDALDRLRGMDVVRQFETVRLEPHEFDRRACTLSVHYRSGDIQAALADIQKTRIAGKRFVVVRGAVVDCCALRGATLLGATRRVQDSSGRLRLSRAALLRLRSVGADGLEVVGESEPAQRVRSLLSLAPTVEARPLRGLKSDLRPYQVLGLRWLLFLWDNGFGGLLCDEMGLGKTHQALGLLVATREQRGRGGTCLVVCPTTVIPHWQWIITSFAPSLTVHVHHGSERDIEQAADANVVVTSYALLRNDIDHLKADRYELVIFDEAQNLKNPSAQVTRAARVLDADMKLGLTGTPVENTPQDLKSLFDLVVPGYLGEDDEFASEFVRPLEEGDRRAHESLKRLTAPFVLRRAKKTVLTDLPPKIEDVRTCGLSDEQMALYTQTVKRKAQPLIKTLRDETTPTPFMHIFAVLNRLKQICDHPALVLKSTENYQEHQSEKWDLFAELLDECLGSAQKAVVYTQYLGMVDIIDRHLSAGNVPHVTLTGASRNRGALVQRFNTDESCRVLVGTLGAGGVGIDLTAASVVFHYDRWWNAAREDQATDRVHRIGQTRGVQVFKLVTEGTLEEGIDSLISTRRELARTLPEEDAPDTLKSFSRDELAELLGDPKVGRRWS